LAGVIVLDAGVLIAHLDATDGHHDRAAELLLLAADQAQPLGASPITLAAAVLGQLGVCAVDLPLDAAVRLAALRAATTLKLPDCCVLLAADQVADAVATFDDRLAGAARSHGLTVWGD
jgi:predicted nucleic acid-binding protein